MADAGIPQPTNTINAPVARQIVYDANNNPIYVGLAEPGSSVNSAVWQIQKITYDANGNALSIAWAGGTPAFSNVWANYASLTYF